MFKDYSVKNENHFKKTFVENRIFNVEVHQKVLSRILEPHHKVIEVINPVKNFII